MKNKGFTLLELLAVIVILAVIALIATPIILNLISDSKKSSDKVSIDMYARAVEQSIAKEELTDSIPDGSYTTVDGRTLERNGKTISVDYSGKAVICKIIIKKKDILFLNDCTVGGVAVDYSYGHIEGDLDGDGFVTEKDKEILKKMIAGTEAINDKADLNGDGRVNGTDANLLKAYLGTIYDINSDGSVNNDDVELLNKMIVGTEAINDKADLNADGRVNGTDANLLKAYISYING